jgi:hypothetical protein
MRLPRDRISGEPRYRRLPLTTFHRLLYAVPLRLRSLFKHEQVERRLIALASLPRSGSVGENHV